MIALLAGMVPASFEMLASPVGGRVFCIVRMAGQEHRFSLTPEDARAVADVLDNAARGAAHGKS